MPRVIKLISKLGIRQFDPKSKNNDIITFKHIVEKIISSKLYGEASGVSSGNLGSSRSPDIEDDSNKRNKHTFMKFQGNVAARKAAGEDVPEKIETYIKDKKNQQENV
jgi:hypothetical protein